jgi:lysophospholipase L1-like esterase
MPSLYNRTCLHNPALIWDCSKWIPQVVVINLGTNDFSTQPFPDKAVFQEDYTQLINRIQVQYPDVTIFCLCGPMIGEPCGTYIEEVVKQIQQSNNNKRVHYINISRSIMDMSDWGSDWHPGINGHQKMADIVLPVIREKMNW